jgi:hypothetical protein
MKRIMKKILKYSLLAVLGFVLAANTGCKKSELDTDQFNGFSLAAVSPNPVMRGAELRMVGAGLENVTEVRMAGDVTITDITVVKSGAQSEIRVMVPLEGPEVGKVTVVSNDGRSASTRFDLTFTEPIVIDSFSPDVVWSGDVLTFKGEYLNDVKTVIFAGDVMVADFVSQSRHELSVKVPGNIITGPVILSDVDELTDESTIPNHIYTADDLGVGAPVVDAIEDKPTVKAGQIVTVTGEHLDMIQTVDMPNAEDLVFELNAAATEMKFVMPATALSGNLMMTSYDGDVYEVGEIDVVVVKDLTVTAVDGRFKGGYEVEITGSDLDLVTKVEFGGNVEAEFYYIDGTIYTNLPFAAKDGPVTVTMESGAKATSEDIEVVKPHINASSSSGVAGETNIVIVGTDLDLVTSAKIGTKKQSFIDCEYEIKFDEDEEEYYVVVALPEQAYTAPIVLASAAGYETETDEIEVHYDMAVSVKFTSPSYGLADQITIEGKNLLQVEQVYLKGKKVTSFNTRTDDAMSFAVPEGVGPGVYRLSFVLVDDTELTWPVPFEITAPFTETFYWEGSEDLGSWSNQPYLGADGALAGNVVVGDLIRIYYTHYADWWQFEIFDGHWGGMSFPELDGGKAVTANNADPDATYFAFEVTNDNIGALTSSQGWGGILVLQGESVVITGLSVIHFGAAETVIYEGPTSMTWDDTGRFGLALKYFEDAGPNATLTIYFTQTENWGQVQLNDGWWDNSNVVFPEIGGAYLTTDNAGGKDVTKIELTVTEELLEHFKSHAGDYFGLNTEYQGDGRVGMVLQGQDWIIDKITIM